MAKRFALTVYFDSDEQLRHFKAKAALEGKPASDFAKSTLVDTLELPSFFSPSDSSMNLNSIVRESSTTKAVA